MKEKTGQVLVQAPPAVANFLLNEKRKSLVEIELRHEVPVIVVADDKLETPHFEIERIKSTEINGDAKPSYERVTPVVAAPPPQVAKPGAEPEKPAVSGVMPASPAPLKPETEAAATLPAIASSPAAKSGGFFARVASWFKYTPEAAAAPVAAPQRNARAAAPERSGSRSGDQRQRQRTDAPRGQTQSGNRGRNEPASARREAPRGEPRQARGGERNAQAGNRKPQAANMDRATPVPPSRTAAIAPALPRDARPLAPATASVVEMLSSAVVAAGDNHTALATPVVVTNPSTEGKPPKQRVRVAAAVVAAVVAVATRAMQSKVMQSKRFKPAPTRISCWISTMKTTIRHRWQPPSRRSLQLRPPCFRPPWLLRRWPTLRQIDTAEPALQIVSAPTMAPAPRATPKPEPMQEPVTPPELKPQPARPAAIESEHAVSATVEKAPVVATPAPSTPNPTPVVNNELPFAAPPARVASQPLPADLRPLPAQPRLDQQLVTPLPLHAHIGRALAELRASEPAPPAAKPAAKPAAISSAHSEPANDPKTTSEPPTSAA